MVGGRGGPKIIRCDQPACKPKPSELTQSAFHGPLLQLQENTKFDATNEDDLIAQRDECVSELQGLLDETQEKFDNLPEGLQNGSSGELLQERIDALQSGIDELEGVDITDFEAEEPEDDKKKDEWVQERDAHYENLQQELRSALESISCS